MVDERPAEAAATAAAPIATTAASTAGSGRNARDASGSPAPAAIELLKRIRDLRFSALRSAIYHAARRGFYERAHRTCTALALIGGSGAVAAIGQSMPFTATIAAMTTTIVSALDLVFGFSVRAGEHAALTRRYYSVMAAVGAVDDDVGALELERQIIELYGEERPAMWAVDAVAFNSASSSLYGPRGLRVAITPWQSAMRHVLPFNGVSFPDAVD